MSVIVLKLFKIGYSIQYMPTWINGISLITSLSSRRATTEITAGINCGKVKKRWKNTQLEKDLLAWAAEKWAHWYCWPVNCVLFETSPVPGVTAGLPLPTDICVTFQRQPREQWHVTIFSFPFRLRFFQCTQPVQKWTSYAPYNKVCLFILHLGLTSLNSEYEQASLKFLK